MTLDMTFWQGLLKLTKADNSTAVPEITSERAFSIFQPEDHVPHTNNIFSLRPAFTGLVRKAGPEPKLFFELGDEYIVELEVTQENAGMFLAGFIHGFDDAPVVLYGEECVYQASMEAGSFSFEALPKGKYALSFSQGGEDYWVTDLRLGTDPSI